MSLTTNTPDGPTHPGAVTVDGQQELVSAAVAAGTLLSRWANKSVLADVCDRSLASDFGGAAQPIGDKIRVPRRDRHRVTQGIAFTKQPTQRDYIDLSLYAPEGIHSAENMWTSPIYRDAKVERMRDEDKMDRLIDRVEETIGEEMAKAETGYWRGTQSYTLPASGNAQLGAAGQDSTSHPDVKLLTSTRRDLVERGINNRELCALLDPATQEGLSRAAVNAPFVNPLATQTYGAAGRATGMGKVGWAWKESVHNGTDAMPGNYAITVNATPTEAAANATYTDLRLNIPSGSGLAARTRIEIEDVKGVNEATSNPVTGRAGFVVHTTSPTAGTSKVVRIQPPMRASTTGDEVRRRTCSELPTAGKKVYVYGMDSGETRLRAGYNGVTTGRSFLVARDTTMLVFMDPDLPASGNDNERARMIRNRAYKVAFALIDYFFGDQVEHRHRLDARWGAVTSEPEAGWLAGAAVI